MRLLKERGRFGRHGQARRHRRAGREGREGSYLLRPNLQADSAAELWTKYIQLTEAETAFRALKSELSIRPLFHRLERRGEGPILVGVFGGALLGGLKEPRPGEKNQMCPSQWLSLRFSLHSGP